MKLHRFIGDFNLSQKNIKIEEKEILNQFRNVLRLKAGSRLILSDGNVNEAEAAIVSLSKDFAELRVRATFKNKNEPKSLVILYCSILKRENFEFVVQKATEVGVKEIVPIITQRTVKLDFKRERLEKIIKEAAEQSGRGIVPQLQNIRQFEEAAKEAKENDRNLFFDASGEPFYPRESASGLRKSATNPKIGIWVGAEGGWDEEELKTAREKGFKIVSLGKLNLRSETAAILASYLISNQ